MKIKMMHVAVRVFLLLCLVAGVLVLGPTRSFTVLSGSCVLIPCEFEIAPSAEPYLAHGNCAAIWTSHTSETREFDSRRSKELSIQSNALHGTLIGDLRERNCSTLLDDVPSHYHDLVLQFQLECDDRPIYTLSPKVHLIVEDSAPQPVILDSTPAVVLEGTLLDLGCRAPVLCPTLPPLLTWSPQSGNITLAAEGDAIFLSMTFIASYLHNNARMTCSAIYRRQAGRTELSTRRVKKLQVLFPPKFLKLSRCQEEPGRTFCICVSRANPAPILTWEWSGMAPNPQRLELVEQRSVDITTIQSVVLLKSLNDSLLCISRNRFGSVPFAFNASNTSSVEPQKNVAIWTLSALKVTLMLGLNVLLWYFCRYRKTKVKTPSSEKQENDTPDRSPTPEMEPVYYNAS
ncbi:myelin-associated glycoprotein-like [Stigmatopora nigra]